MKNDFLMSFFLHPFLLIGSLGSPMACRTACPVQVDKMRLALVLLAPLLADGAYFHVHEGHDRSTLTSLTGWYAEMLMTLRTDLTPGT